MTLRKERVRKLKADLKNRVLVIDGAMGTAIQDMNLVAVDFGGVDLEGCNENLVLTRPDIISQVHENYLKAGADIIETNTFGGTPVVLDEYGLGSKAKDINLAAARLARQACDKFSTPTQMRYVAGSVGPTTKAISVTGGITFESLIDNFYEQIKALHEGGCDYILFETAQDTRNIKAGMLAVDRYFSEIPADEIIPVAVSVTIEPMGTMLAGQSIEALATSLDHLDLLYVGLNCATGPEFMTDHIRSLSQLTRAFVACVPNAGLPDENGIYLETPEMMSQVLKRFGEAGWLNLIGGCCGTTSKHIEAFSKLAPNLTPRVPQDRTISTLSGIDYTEITDEQRPVIVGERTNVIGSRKFKELIKDNKFEEAAEIARGQVRQGAQIIDICLANPDSDEKADMEEFLKRVTKMVRAPLMIDSTDEDVIAMALTYCQGKAIINSINLEDGEERFEKVVPLAKKFGAALVVGTIDDDPIQGMGVTRQRKLEIAEKSYDLLTKKYGVRPCDIYWDPLVFPCATGDKQYIGSAPETIEGIRLIKKKYPETKTVLGISNVSFGLPAAGREVLNSVFLYYCVQAGLDLAIVNSEKLERYASISDEEKKLCDDLIYHCDDSKIAAFTDFYRTKKTKSADDTALKNLTPEERLALYIVQGTKEGLIADLDLTLAKMKPLEVINGPLMKGMDEVGKLFNNNELIVAEVLQSAEVMKAAVGHLEPLMDKDDSAMRGKIVLATVKGDVHDIGKNLVDIILSNNGFKVINLGIKIPPEQLVQAIREHNPHMVGLSGLLVKSAQQMVITAQDFTQSKISIPILVGGAALTENFTFNKIMPAYNSGDVFYAKDAMQGLEIAKQIVDKEKFEVLKQNIAVKLVDRKKVQEKAEVKRFEPSRTRSAAINTMTEIPQPPDYERHIINNVPLDHLWNFVNPRMLLGRHLGVKGSTVKLVEEENWAALKSDENGRKALEILEVVEELKAQWRTKPFKPKGVFQFFEAASDGNFSMLYSNVEAEALRRAPAEPKQSPKPLMTFDFPRQAKPNGMCLSDYLNPLGSTPQDNVCLFVVSAGEGIRPWAEKLKEEGKYLQSHILQALALETAEAFAEYLHSKIRAMWGFADLPEMTMMERFQAKYRGKRYSFGYPACPILDDQAKLFGLIKPQDIGVDLTEGFMMDPEASVSAIVFSHPACSYFGVGDPIA